MARHLPATRDMVWPIWASVVGIGGHGHGHGNGLAGLASVLGWALVVTARGMQLM